MRSKKNKIIILIIFLLVVIGSIALMVNNVFLKDSRIDYVLKTESYSYLPKEAQNYIKEIYEETGEVILTEKNKEGNKPYLNPIYIQYLSSSSEGKNQFSEIPFPTIVDYSAREETKDINVPSKYDLRTSYVTPVRDQGELGLCWAFASAGAVESHLLKIDSSISINSPKLFSERQLDYATSINGIKDYNSEYVSFIKRSLGDGGNFYISTIAMANGISLVDYNSFKSYNDQDFTKMELADVLSYNNSQYEVNATIMFPRMNLRQSTDNLTANEIETRESYLKEVKKNIMENGAAYVGTYMSNGCKYNDKNLNNVVIDVYNCSISGSHAMQIVGWDDNLEWSYCNDTMVHGSDTKNCKKIVSGKGVWILKNSWGEELPYLYLTYDSLYSSVNFIDEIESAVDKNWDNNYVLGSESSVNQGIYYLIDTQIKDYEIIKKVKFIAESSNTVYSLKIYQDDGTYKQFSKSTGMPGLITIDIPEGVKVDKNSKINISSNGTYIDKVSIFTENNYNSSLIDLDKYNNTIIADNEFRLYSETKNIPSGTTIKYSFTNVDTNENVDDKVIISNNVVAENNINTLFKFDNSLKGGTYRIKAYIGLNGILSTINIKYETMTGSGTASDPYVIKNSTHLNKIRDDLDGYYVLGNDIDLTKDTREGGKFCNAPEEEYQFLGCHGWEPINGFSGTLDGNGYAIKGLYQNTFLKGKVDGYESYAQLLPLYVGFFGTTKGNLTIKNLVLENFEVNCNGDCGLLVGYYNNDYNDKNSYDITLSNISVKNSKMNGVYNSRLNRSDIELGGLLGYINHGSGKITLSNIYLDMLMSADFDTSLGGLAHTLATTGNLVIRDIQLVGGFDSTRANVINSGILVHSVYAVDMNISNILSTIYHEQIGANLIKLLHINTSSSTSSLLSIKNLSMFKIPNTNLYELRNQNDDYSEFTTISNVCLHDFENGFLDFFRPEIYDTWHNFNKFWTFKSIDGVQRFPVLKVADFKYTSIDNISITQKLNEHKNIYDYIYPNTISSKRISFKSNDENIVKIDEHGVIIPQSTGRTTIHIESYYDGYMKDVPINIEYVPHYNVYFDANGGTGVMDSVEVSVGQKYILPENEFVKDEYNFVGWNTKADGSGVSYENLGEISSMKDKESITLYAQWLGEEYILTFDAAGGTSPLQYKKVYKGDVYGELPIPVRDGYGFKSWLVYYSSNIANIIFSTTLVNSSETLVADWEENSYTIVFNQNGGVGYTIHDYANFDSDHVLSENKYTKEGSKFVGWNTKIDGTGTYFNDKDTINLDNVKDSYLVLYAQWSNNKAKVTFNSNDGTNNEQVQELDYNTSTKLNKNTFAREGYEFIGWNTKVDGTGVSYSNEQEVTLTSDLVLYAQWEAIKYKVTFNSNDGTNNEQVQELDYNTSTKLNKNTFARDGYEFTGWNTKVDGTGVSYSNEQEVTLTSDLKLYAQWKEKGSYGINKYLVDETNKHIDLIDINTTLEEFKSNITLGTDYAVKVDTKIINDKEVLYTGGKTKIYKNNELYIEYTNIVRGDANGDGIMDIFDYIRIMKDIMKDAILDGVYKIGADITQDNKVDIFDYIRIMKKIMGEN